MIAVEHRLLAAELLLEWNEYRQLHYSHCAALTNAIDIELAKGAAQVAATSLQEMLLYDTDPFEYDSRIACLKSSLSLFKDLLTMELLAHGPI